MSCGCRHLDTKSSGTDTLRIGPFSQCIFCAQKHADEAMVAMNEYAYDLENRSYIHGSVRAVVNHTFRSWPAIAATARKAALLWQLADFAGARCILMDAIGAIDREIRRQDADIADRIRMAELSPVDVIIPLGPGSYNGLNDELRILLRSLCVNCTGLGRIIIVTDCAPDWLDPAAVCILPMGDKYDDNKDANLIDKTLAAIDQFDVKSFVWMADDNAIMKPLDLRHAEKVRNTRVRADFPDDRIWHARMRHTFDSFAGLTCNYDSHTPQPFGDARKLATSMRTVRYQPKPGLCIMTTFYAAMGEATGGRDQNDVKTTISKSLNAAEDIATKLYLGYDDKGFAQIRDHLFNIFPKKSRYEK